ncbi:dynein light chain binding protein [Aureococcus anophagefferens]|nr:dynein light chain binding protein [Aureococcus anophagefferens]
MAADFIKLVLLNLGATEDEWADAVAIDEEAVALDAYSKTGGVALQSGRDETPSGSAVFFYFETHADKGKPAERLRCHSYTIRRAASTSQRVPQARQRRRDLEAGAAKHEFQRNVVWFESVLSHAMKQVKGDVPVRANIDIEGAGGVRGLRRMVPLMERIAYKIAEKVETEVNIKAILRRSPEQAKKDLGPELKAVTGESDGIDQVMERVERLVEPLESVPFNIFDRRYKVLNFPPVARVGVGAGSVPAKKPVLRFKAHEGLLSTEYGEQVAAEKLKQPILAAAGKEAKGDAGEGDGGRRRPTPSRAQWPQQVGAKFKMPPPPYASTSSRSCR